MECRRRREMGECFWEDGVMFVNGDEKDWKMIMNRLIESVDGGVGEK